MPKTIKEKRLILISAIYNKEIRLIELRKVIKICTKKLEWKIGKELKYKLRL